MSISLTILLSIYAILVTRSLYIANKTAKEQIKSINELTNRHASAAQEREDLKDKLINQQEARAMAERNNFDNTETLLRMCFEHLMVVACMSGDVVISHHYDKPNAMNSRYYISILTQKGTDITKIKIAREEDRNYPRITVDDEDYACSQFQVVAQNIQQRIKKSSQLQVA